MRSSCEAGIMADIILRRGKPRGSNLQGLPGWAAGIRQRLCLCVRGDVCVRLASELDALRIELCCSVCATNGIADRYAIVQRDLLSHRLFLLSRSRDRPLDVFAIRMTAIAEARLSCLACAAEPVRA